MFSIDKLPYTGAELHGGALTPFLLFVAGLLVLVYWLSTSTDIGQINGIPEIPYALPFFGHLLQLGEDQATSFQRLWHRYQSSIFQVRLGTTRAVVVNSFDDCRRMLISHQSSVIDRPVLHTVGVIASTKGLTIGTSPWDDSTKRRRKAVGTALGRSKLKNYHEMFDLESYCVIRDLEKISKAGTTEVSLKHLIQRYALNSTLTLSYGVRMNGVYEEMMEEILDVGHSISLLRGTSENLQDFVPVMRYFPNNEKDRLGRELRSRRDQYLESLLITARGKVQQGISTDCVYSAVLKDEETNLTKEEISTVCLSMISGGFETVPATLLSCIGSLSRPEGLIIQENAYKDICRYYSSTREAWQECFKDEKVPYINAIIKEALRYYTVLPMGQPRKTTKDIDWNGSTIPARTMILLNTQAANHDVNHFGPTANVFDPTRWLEPDSAIPRERESTGIQHFGFGGGSRACPGIIIAHRLLYTALVRLITSYRIEASGQFPPTTHYSDYNTTKTALVAVPEDFKVNLIPRDTVELNSALEEASRRTAQSV
ncbi:hypothetical protein MMC30_007683 [Trapelia coarctata]|nr:hypothetical protein [Trapelia coarctata]